MRRYPRLASRGYLVEHHANEAQEFPERELQQHNLFLYTGPASRAEIKSPAFSGIRWMRPGTFWVMPAGSRHSVRFEGRTEGIALAFHPGRFASLVERGGGKYPSRIVESLAACPPKLDHLMRALACESDQPSTADHFGLECIATAVALALCQQAGVSESAPKTGPRLSLRQVRVVQSYVKDHLEGKLSLAQLARLVGLSSFYFLRAFRQTLGVTPRQYVFDRRMDRAKSCLQQTRLTVGEIALRTGFEHPSHFSRAFHRAHGVTPSAYREATQR